MQQLYCYKKDCDWNEAKVKERKAAIDELNKQQGVCLVPDHPLFSFYKSKSKQLKNQKNRCTESNEIYCQQHYFQKKLEQEACKKCGEEHEYEEQQPPMIKMYADKKRKISNKDSRHDRLNDYLSAYLEYEQMDTVQYKDLDKKINEMQTKNIDRKLLQATRPKMDLFTLEQIYKIDNLPNVEIKQRVEEQKKDHAITQFVSGYDKRISSDKGISQLLKRYPINQ